MNTNSTISLHLTFRKDTPQYVIDFFTKGTKNEELPSVLYNYGFVFDNKPNFSDKTTMLCSEKNGQYCLHIYHHFDFQTEATEAYWFVGGLAQYAEDDDLAGYIKYTFEDVQSQIFGFRNKMCYWQNDVSINFNWAKYINADLTFRDMEKHETPFLEDMLHQAIFTPEGSTPPEKSIIFEPFLHHYIADFGREDDVAMVAEVEGKLVGAAWSRLFSDEQGYGFVDAETPELSIAIDLQHRNSGIGRILFYDFLQKLRKKGYKQVSLSVDMRNFAYALYKKSGFEVVETKGNSAIMVFKF